MAKKNESRIFKVTATLPEIPKSNTFLTFRGQKDRRFVS